MSIDIVCGMDVTEFSERLTIRRAGKTYSFCGTFCKERYALNPQRYASEPLISLIDVWKVFRGKSTETSVLRGLHMRVWEGDFVAMIGASGSGKSTALNMIGLLDRPSKGTILFQGKDISRLSDEERAHFRSEKFGFVFQQYNLIPWLNAYENGILPRIFAGKAVDYSKAKHYIAQLGLTDRTTHRPAELSGGEQQRVALFRALANDPDVIIGDEPTGNLDSATGNKILDLLIELNKERKKTLIIVTHDADIAAKADQVITLKDGQSIPNHQMHRKIYTE